MWLRSQERATCSDEIGGYHLRRLPPRASMRALRGAAGPAEAMAVPRRVQIVDFNKNEDLCLQMA